jgi:hypothetical protein
MPFPLDRARVKATEDKLGVRFPVAFVERMLEDNGGELDIEGEAWSLHPFLDDGDSVRLARTCNDIVRETRQALEWPNFPRNGIAIADNGMGDQLVFMPSAAAPGQLADAVFMWSHESGEIDKVANDFAELR